MHQVDNETAVSAMPPFEELVRAGWFSKGGQAQAPTYPGADWFNMIQAEGLNLLAAAGLAPNKDDLHQWAEAVRTIAQEKIEDGGFLQASKNLADVASKSEGRNNLDVPSNDEVSQALNSLAEAFAQALSDHENAPNPHPQYATEEDVEQSIGEAIEAHKNATNPHSQYAREEQIGEAIDEHERSDDPHSQYLKKDETPSVPVWVEIIEYQQSSRPNMVYDIPDLAERGYKEVMIVVGRGSDIQPPIIVPIALWSVGALYRAWYDRSPSMVYMLLRSNTEFEVTDQRESGNFKGLFAR
ncbi:hypothetical protein F9L16_23930 [Agarivorans sp. B2Z047]|uniref:hypothetical protein n=1 Tax=Agarivorans sp. B2Z047 TaxID=2652721 RepID=UPI00128C5A58|nr:hypothetical protein [Agarivorans sp. B2Z047]MPW31997.1 hypothetical protein [Agarivorans sp. B2Z047]UQN43751.1 hypothetical protein LQZ07_04580 [Agarivorans sp. B2Z047]